MKSGPQRDWKHRTFRRVLARAAMVLPLAILSGCNAWRSYPPPPAPQTFDGLPISGSRADAQGAGFTYCLDFKTKLRCRRQGVMLMGHGPYSAAIDLLGGDGRGGFDHLILWHDRDQHALTDIARMLERQGWQLCRTGIENWGDQDIYTHPDSRFKISIDVSYYGKRRLRIFLKRNEEKPKCE